MARSDPQTNIRLPAALKANLLETAKAANRTFASEVVARLSETTLPAVAASASPDRGMIAAMAMQALVSNPSMCDQRTGMPDQIAQWGVQHADALLAELAKDAP